MACFAKLVFDEICEIKTGDKRNVPIFLGYDGHAASPEDESPEACRESCGPFPCPRVKGPRGRGYGKMLAGDGDRSGDARSYGREKNAKEEGGLKNIWAGLRCRRRSGACSWTAS